MAQATIITGKGNKVKLYLTFLPSGVSTEPTEFTITPTADITAASTSFTPTAALAVGENLAVGTPIVFSGGDTDIKKVVWSTADVIGDGVSTPTINIRPAYETITAGAGSVGKTRLLGGRTLDRNFTTNQVESIHHEDTAAYLVSALVSKNLEIPWTGDTSPGYTSFFFLQEVQAQAEASVWFELELTPPGGFTTGLITKNCAIISDYSDTWPSDAECQYNFTIKNQGTPTIVQPAV